MLLPVCIATCMIAIILSSLSCVYWVLTICKPLLLSRYGTFSTFMFIPYLLCISLALDRWCFLCSYVLFCVLRIFVVPVRPFVLSWNQGGWSLGGLDPLGLTLSFALTCTGISVFWGFLLSLSFEYDGNWEVSSIGLPTAFETCRIRQNLTIWYSEPLFFRTLDEMWKTTFADD